MALWLTANWQSGLPQKKKTLRVQFSSSPPILLRSAWKDMPSGEAKYKSKATRSIGSL